MARELGRFNPGFAGSTANLSRSNTSLNTIGNVMFVDGVSGSPYNTLQRNNIHNVNPRPQRGQNAVYDDIGPGAASIVNNSKTSQTSRKPGRTRQRRRERIIRVVLMCLIIFVAIIALLLALLLMMGKVGPKCSCSTSGRQVCFSCTISYLFLLCWYAGGLCLSEDTVYLNANSVHSLDLKVL